jgi:hypothetical protein
MKPPKIHFISLVSVDLDLDMLPYFLPHYNALGLDNYCLFLHEGKSPDDNLWAESAAKDLGWKVRFVPRNASFCNGDLRKALFNKFQKAVPPTDYIMTSSGDELQNWTGSPYDFVSGDFDVILGLRFDRFSDSLRGINPEDELENIYPIQHPNLTKEIFPNKPRSNDKIILSKAAVPVDFKKSTSLLTKDTSNLKVTGDISIYHYKWRDNIFNRLRERSDYTPDEIRSIKNFFEVRG